MSQYMPEKYYIKCQIECQNISYIFNNIYFNYVVIIVRVVIIPRKYLFFNIHLIRSLHCISFHFIQFYFGSLHFGSVVHVVPSFISFVHWSSSLCAFPSFHSFHRFHAFHSFHSFTRTFFISFYFISCFAMSLLFLLFRFLFVHSLVHCSFDSLITDY